VFKVHKLGCRLFNAVELQKLYRKEYSTVLDKNLFLNPPQGKVIPLLRDLTFPQWWRRRHKSLGSEVVWMDEFPELRRTMEFYSSGLSSPRLFGMFGPDDEGISGTTRQGTHCHIPEYFSLPLSPNWSADTRQTQEKLQSV